MSKDPEVFSDVPQGEVGQMVQEFIDDGAATVTVSRNADGKTCTVKIEF